MLRRGTSNDRWLISYADFITLLFATFVLMYVMAKKNEGKRVLPSLLPQSAQNIQTLSPSLLNELTNTLQLERSQHIVSLSSEPRGLVITLDDKACFEPGQALVQPMATPVFEKIAHILEEHSNRVLLEGHTDSTPIHNSAFRSNWELSAARSIAVMEVMQEHSSLKPDRFLVAGSAETTPVFSNGTVEGRTQNRRVDIIVLDDAISGSAGSVLNAKDALRTQEPIPPHR